MKKLSTLLLLAFVGVLFNGAFLFAEESNTFPPRQSFLGGGKFCLGDQKI